MEFQILGPLEARGERGAVTVRGLKPRAVLAVLLLHANEPVSAERLAVALWGQDAPARAVKTVQVHVSRLRKALGDPGVLTTTPAGYRLRVRPGELDAERFARGAAQGRSALEAGDAERARVLLRDALQLWRGPALAELAFEPFAPAEIARLEEQRLVALEARVEADLARGAHGALVSELQQLRGEHPTRERLAIQLMVALYRSGRQAEALAVFRNVRQILVEDAGIEPGAELQRLHDAILRQDASLELPTLVGELPRQREPEAVAPVMRDVPVTASPARRSALPVSPNRTIGRDREIGLLSERLRAGAVRLLTLTGPGGVGKTRLALETAHAVELDFADGARFVSLAAVRRPQDVPAAIVNSLEITPLAGESADHAVERFLAAKHLLLVVDNCEHLPDAAAFVGGLVLACPTATVLATSREPLAVQAEHCFPVSPLSLPEARTDAEALASVAAVALYCERARARDPDFELGHGNGNAVAEICRRVDGLPLAIELAAARSGLLSPAEIAERLHGTLGALGRGARDAPARHRTLRATIDWSHQLLGEDEQACFARFAVFAGGATIEATETITGAGIDTLDRLVAKSLLVRRQVQGRTRLRMLETVRAYAAERFAAVADAQLVQEGHYRYFLQLAQRHANQRALWGASRNQHLARLDAEIDNVHAALAWAAGQATARPLLELCAEFGGYWLTRVRFADAVEWIDEALTKPDADRHPALQVRVLRAQAWALWPLGRGTESRAVTAEARAIARTQADIALYSRILADSAVHAGLDGEFEAATTLADQALHSAKTSGNRWAIAMAASARALAEINVAELSERVDAAATLLKETGNAYHYAVVYHLAADRALSSGAERQALKFCRRAIPLVRELDDPFEWMFLHGSLGMAAILSGDPKTAAHAFREQLKLCHELVVLPATAPGLAGLAAVAALRDDLDRAARLSGATAAHRYGTPLAPYKAAETRLAATLLEPARTRHGRLAWDAAVREGAALSFNDAIAYALDEPRLLAEHGSSDPTASADDDH